MGQNFFLRVLDMGYTSGVGRTCRGAEQEIHKNSNEQQRNSNEKQSIIIVILFFFMIPVPFSGEAPSARRLFRESAKLVNGFIYGHFTCPKTINSLS